MENQKQIAIEYINKRIALASSPLDIGVAGGAIAMAEKLGIITKEEKNEFIIKLEAPYTNYQKAFFEKYYESQGKTYDDYLKDTLV